MKQLNLDLEDDVFDILEMKAEIHGMTLHDYIVEALNIGAYVDIEEDEEGNVEFEIDPDFEQQLNRGTGKKH